jgi:hypothetical protein
MPTSLPPSSPTTRYARQHLVRLTGLCTLTMLACDFFLHAGILASFYRQPSPFFLPAELAFQRIPFGYAAVLLLASFLLWLLVRLRLHDARRAAVFGIQAGMFVGGAMMLGLWSISSANGWLLVGWWVGQTLELGLAGYVAGSGLGTARLGALSVKVLAVVGVLVTLTIILQTVGIAPTSRALAP